jgi:hypothetical protein
MTVIRSLPFYWVFFVDHFFWGGIEILEFKLQDPIKIFKVKISFCFKSKQVAIKYIGTFFQSIKG